MVYFEWLGQNAITMVLLLASYFEKEKHLPKADYPSVIIPDYSLNKIHIICQVNLYSFFDL